MAVRTLDLNLLPNPLADCNWTTRNRGNHRGLGRQISGMPRYLGLGFGGSTPICMNHYHSQCFCGVMSRPWLSLVCCGSRSRRCRISRQSGCSLGVELILIGHVFDGAFEEVGTGVGIYRVSSVEEDEGEAKTQGDQSGGEGWRGRRRRIPELK